MTAPIDYDAPIANEERITAESLARGLRVARRARIASRELGWKMTIELAHPLFRPFVRLRIALQRLWLSLRGD